MGQRSTQEEASDLFAVILRKQHKKDIAQEAVKKRRRATKKPYSRSIVGAILEVIQKKRAEKPEVRDAAREAALRCVSCLISTCCFRILLGDLFILSLFFSLIFISLCPCFSLLIMTGISN